MITLKAVTIVVLVPVDLKGVELQNRIAYQVLSDDFVQISNPPEAFEGLYDPQGNVRQDRPVDGPV